MSPKPSDPSFFRFGLVVGLLALVPALFAQPANPPANPGNADSELRALIDRALPPSARAPARTLPRTAAEQAQERSDQLAHFLGIADEARSFGDSHASHAKAAQMLEAKSLLRAAFLGDKTREARLQALVGELANDKTLPSKDRFEVVAMSEHLLLRELAKNSPQARVAREESARYLMREFPTERGGYEALLSAAENGNDVARVKAMTQHVIDSPAPFAAKAEARILAGRYDLIGKSLADVANTALGRGNYFEKTRERQVLLYTWATWSKGSIAYAKGILTKSPKGALIIGYNLDRDMAAAKKIATREGLPGEHYYNDGGVGSQLALLLKLNAAPMVYITDAHGIIRDVGAQHGDLADRFAAVK